jgi:hypothetical protein
MTAGSLSDGEHREWTSGNVSISHKYGRAASRKPKSTTNSNLSESRARVPPSARCKLAMNDGDNGQFSTFAVRGVRVRVRDHAKGYRHRSSLER